MLRRANAILSLAALALAAPGRADDPYPDSYQPEAPQVDVSVDLATPGAAVNFETFREGLSPYGEWTTMGAYGPVWRPNVPVGWRPYYYGRWVWTDEGWLWVSDEPWGWGPYHYGRWLFDASYGWFWVPGYQWAPAWVSWRFSGDVVGWAPLAPGFSLYVTNYPVSYSAWTFVPCTSFVGFPVHTVAYAPSHYPGFFRRTVPAPPRASAYGAIAPAWGGPAHRFVEHRLGRTIPPTPIRPVASPGQARGSRRGEGAIPVFRPPAPVAPPAPRAEPRPHPGWGPPQRPGFGPPGRVPAPGAAPGSRPDRNRPGWGTPPSRGPSPVPPGARAAPPASPRGWAPPRSAPGTAPRQQMPSQRMPSQRMPSGPAAPRAAPPAQRGPPAPAAAPAPRGGHRGDDSRGHRH